MMSTEKNLEIKRILHEKYGIELSKLDVFPGTNPDATVEQIADEIAKVFLAEEDEFYFDDDNDEDGFHAAQARNP